MADHNKPQVTSTYTNFVSELNARIRELTQGLTDQTVNTVPVTSPTNLPTNAIRWSANGNKWQKWSGTAWSDLATTYAINISGSASSVTNGVVTTGSYSDPAWITSLAGSKISGNIGGNAATATKLATARNINGVAFDGSAAITVNTDKELTFSNEGSGGASGTTFNGSTARTISYNSVGAPKADGTGASGTWGISVSGSAGSAESATSAGSLVTTNFTVEESGTDLIIKYGETTILKITSDGAIVTKDDITAFGTL